MNFIFISISSSDTNLLRKKSVKQKIKKNDGLSEVIKEVDEKHKRQDLYSPLNGCACEEFLKFLK